MRIRLREHVSIPTGTKVQRDPESGRITIPGVKFLGNRSSNRNSDGTHNVYPLKTRKAALPLYEGAPVYLNHRDPKSKTPRGYDEKLGRLRNVQALEHGSIGDLELNPKHPQAEKIAWDAEHSPDSVGLSHDARGVGRVSGKDCLIEEIYHASSVDVVDAGATTRSLFEHRWDQEDDEMNAKAMLAALLEGHNLAMPADHDRLLEMVDEQKLLAVLTDEAMDDASKVMKALGLLAMGKGDGEGEEGGEGEGGGTTGDAPAQEARKPQPANRPSAAEVSLREQNDNLRRRLDELEVAHRGRERRETRESQLKEAKLPAGALSEFFREELFAVEDDAKAKQMIEDRKALYFGGRPVSSLPASAGGKEITKVGRFLTTDEEV